MTRSDLNSDLGKGFGPWVLGDDAKAVHQLMSFFDSGPMSVIDGVQIASFANL